MHRSVISPSEALLDLSMPLVIITAGIGKEKAGMTACWVTQVSWKPPYLGIAIYHKWRTLELIMKYKEFAVHLVSEDLVQPALKVFGALSSRKVDKFNVVKEKYGLEVTQAQKVKALILPSAPIIIECRLLTYHVIGDHYLVVCEPVIAYRNNNKKPVTCYKGLPYRIGEKVIT